MKTKTPNVTGPFVTLSILSNNGQSQEGQCDLSFSADGQDDFSEFVISTMPMKVLEVDVNILSFFVPIKKGAATNSVIEDEECSNEATTFPNYAPEVISIKRKIFGKEFQTPM